MPESPVKLSHRSSHRRRSPPARTLAGPRLGDAAQLHHLLVASHGRGILVAGIIYRGGAALLPMPTAGLEECRAGHRQLVDPAIWKLVEDILGAGRDLALVVTGGGSRAVTWLLDHPGASRAVVEVQVPYHHRALDAYIGRPGPHRVIPETARLMARRAHGRARCLAGPSRGHVGVACTAALTTRRRRRGRDHAFLAVRLDDGYRFVDVHLASGLDRSRQEEIVSRALVCALGEACGLACTDLPDPGGQAEPPPTSRTCPTHEPLEALLDGECQMVGWRADGSVGHVATGGGRAILPGSFNPLHAGHRGLATAAARQSGCPVALELSVLNVDKSPIPYEELVRRLQALGGEYDVIITRAATFAEKAALLPGACFAIGYDTAVRLFEARYYGDDPGARSRALAQLRHSGCRLLVAGRRVEGEYRTLADLKLPAECADLLQPIPECDFRCDVSSTELRARESAPRQDEGGG